MMVGKWRLVKRSEEVGNPMHWMLWQACFDGRVAVGRFSRELMREQQVACRNQCYTDAFSGLDVFFCIAWHACSRKVSRLVLKQAVFEFKLDRFKTEHVTEARVYNE